MLNTSIALTMDYYHILSITITILYLVVHNTLLLVDLAGNRCLEVNPRGDAKRHCCCSRGSDSVCVCVLVKKKQTKNKENKTEKKGPIKRKKVREKRVLCVSIVLLVYLLY